jgi:hypothetical protein
MFGIKKVIIPCLLVNMLYGLEPQSPKKKPKSLSKRLSVLSGMLFGSTVTQSTPDNDAIIAAPAGSGFLARANRRADKASLLASVTPKVPTKEENMARVARVKQRQQEMQSAAAYKEAQSASSATPNTSTPSLAISPASAIFESSPTGSTPSTPLSKQERDAKIEQILAAAKKVDPSAFHSNTSGAQKSQSGSTSISSLALEHPTLPSVGHSQGNSLTTSTPRRSTVHKTQHKDSTDSKRTRSGSTSSALELETINLETESNSNSSHNSKQTSVTRHRSSSVQLPVFVSMPGTNAQSTSVLNIIASSATTTASASMPSTIGNSLAVTSSESIAAQNSSSTISSISSDSQPVAPLKKVSPNKQLLQAAHAGNVQMFEQAIKAGADINYVQTNNGLIVNAFIRAIMYGHDHIILSLIDHHADPFIHAQTEAIKVSVYAAQHKIAIKSLTADTIKKLNDYESTCQRVEMNNHKLLLAAFAGDLAQFRQAINNGADKDFIIFNPNGKPPQNSFTRAATSGHEIIIAELIKIQAKPYLIIDDQIVSILDYIANHLKIRHKIKSQKLLKNLNKYIEEQIDAQYPGITDASAQIAIQPHSTNASSSVVLNSSSASSTVDATRSASIVVQPQPNLEQYNKKLMSAAFSGDKKMYDDAIAMGADINHITIILGKAWNPFIRAIYYASNEIIEDLIAKGVNPYITINKVPIHAIDYVKDHLGKSGLQIRLDLHERITKYTSNTRKSHIFLGKRRGSQVFSTFNSASTSAVSGTPSTSIAKISAGSRASIIAAHSQSSASSASESSIACATTVVASVTKKKLATQFLIEAIQKGKPLNEIQKAIADGADINGYIKIDGKFQTALMVAVQKNRPFCIDLLIKENPNPHLMNENGEFDTIATVLEILPDTIPDELLKKLIKYVVEEYEKKVKSIAAVAKK